MDNALWTEELDVCRTMKSLIVLEGQVADMQISRDEAGLDLVALDQFLYSFFSDIGYSVVVFYNRVDGFYNKHDESGRILRTFAQLAALEKDPAEVSIAAAVKGIRRAVVNTSAPTVVVMDLASLLLSSPDHMDAAEIENFASLLLASRESSMARSDTKSLFLNNLILLLVDQASDIPLWVYHTNPYAKVIHIPKPNEENRMELIRAYLNGAGPVDGEALQRLVKKTCALTDGLTNIELNRLLESCVDRRLDWNRIPEEINSYLYGRKDNPWTKIRHEDLAQLEERLSRDVIGQREAIAAAAEVVVRASTGLSGLQHSSQRRPKGVLFFAGPTGTGKTELAKSLARNIFGDERALIRFDMSEYTQEHSDQRLIGAPPGYVGHRAGGELTNAVKKHPFSILLFDEIEKAHSSIMDKFLQILDDGRITDAKGETVYFTETVIVFTSNAGIVAKDAAGRRIPLVTREDPRELIQQRVKDELRRSLSPEILNRLGNNIIVFDFIQEEQISPILEKQITNIFQGIRDTQEIQVCLSHTSGAWDYLVSCSRESLDYGGRGIGNAVEKFLINPLARTMSEDHWSRGGIYEITDIVPGPEKIYLHYNARDVNTFL